MTNDIYGYKYISNGSANQVITGAVTLGKIVIPNTLVGTVQVIDGVSGTTPNVASFGAGTTPGTYIYEVSLATGLRVVTSSASDLITVTFKIH